MTKNLIPTENLKLPTDDLNLEDLIAKAKYKQHPFGKCWQPFDKATFEQLVIDVDHRGLDKEILLYQDMVLDGWHRYLACLATKVAPKFGQFTGSELEAAEAVHASGIRRQVSAQQRYAAFLMLCDECPAFKDKYAQLKEKGEQQQKAGTPLGTGGQRVDVVKAKADAVGVSKTTAKKVERVKKENPKAIADIAAGKTTANKELNKRKAKNGDTQEKQKPARPDKTPVAEKKPVVVTCSLRIAVLPADGKAIQEIISKLCIRKAELWASGLHIWMRNVKPVPLSAGAPMPKGCLGEVTVIAGSGFQLESTPAEKRS